MATWKERFLGIYQEAFELAGRRLVAQPLRVGETVTAMLAGHVNDRAMTLLALEGDEAVIEGWVDGSPGAPVMERVSRASLVRASDMVEILITLGEQRGLDQTEGQDMPEVPEIRH